jgi:catechol 2,3-dioxygenase-like lactoylglutathione lyase family enzyme
MDSRISIIALGVADVLQATAFYQRLGFARSRSSDADIAFLKAGGVVLSLYGRRALADDVGLPADTSGINAPAGFAGFVLAHNVRNEAEVDAVLAEAVAAGGRLVKPGQKVFWGGYSGYFADPDGHLWEVAHNPFSPLDDQGQMQIDWI